MPCKWPVGSMSRSALACIALILTASTAFAQSPERFRRDLASFDRQVRQTHPSLFSVHSEREWNAQVQALHDRAGNIDSVEFYVALQRIMALAEDGHSMVIPTSELRDSALPLAFAFFGDDLYVTCAHPNLAEVVGGRVVMIGTAPINRVIADLRELVRSDNDYGARGLRAALARYAKLHTALGWTTNGNESITVEFSDGHAAKVALNASGNFVRGPFPPHGPTPSGWIDARKDTDHPRWQQYLGEPWWFDYLEDEQCIYVGFNNVIDKADKPINTFWDELFAFIDENDVDKMVIDMRHNGGGDGYKNQPLVHALIRSDKVNRPGHLFVLIGPRTFSAAVMGVAELEQHTYAMFVGEPDGAGPAHFGDPIVLTLPETSMRVRCSAVYHQFTDGRDKRRWTQPDILAPMTFAHFVTGRDPALEAANAYDPANAADFATWPPKAHWMRPSQKDVPARGGD
jgi:hypothetical protein